MDIPIFLIKEKDNVSAQQLIDHIYLAAVITGWD
jgi:hypothetical protein